MGSLDVNVPLARLAIDRRVQHQGMGSLLLVSALKKALRTFQEIGAYAVETLAKDEEAMMFSLENAFKQVVDDRLHLDSCMRMVEKLP